MNPEQLSPGRGEMPACPHCNANLNLADLFGVKDSFVGMHDDQGNDHSLDDLVGGDLYDGRYVDGRAPAPESPTPRQASSSRAVSRARPAPRASTGAMVKHAPNREPDSGGSDSQPSALDLLREMKRKR